MDIIDYLITSISDLPAIISITGLAICAFFTFRAFGFFITLRWIRAATHLVYIVVVLLVMAKYGQQIAQFIQDNQSTKQTTQDPV